VSILSRNASNFIYSYHPCLYKGGSGRETKGIEMFLPLNEGEGKERTGKGRKRREGEKEGGVGEGTKRILFQCLKGDKKNPEVGTAV